MYARGPSSCGRLFKESSPTLQFDLAGGEAYRNGVVHLSYALKAGK